MQFFCLVGAKTPPGKAIKSLFLPAPLLGREDMKKTLWRLMLGKSNRKAGPLNIKIMFIVYLSTQKTYSVKAGTHIHGQFCPSS